jgi:hypothetical protein
MRDAKGRGHALAVLAGVLAIALGGCRTDRWDVELRPRRHGLERTLTVWTEGSGTDMEGRPVPKEQPIGEEVSARLAAIYGEPPKKEGGKAIFRRVFARDMPVDLAGHGGYRRYETTLGALHVWSERFGGTSDIEGLIEARRAWVDTFVAAVTKSLAEEFTGEEGVALREIVESELRRDLLNVMHLSWIAAAQNAALQSRSQHVHPFAGALQPAMHHWVERGYGDAPQAMSLGNYGGVDGVLAWVDRQLDERGRPMDDALKDRLRAFVEREGENWSQQVQIHAALNASAADALLPKGVLRVRLHCETEPSGNGIWDPDARVMTWDWTSIPGADAVPLYRWATWVDVDEEGQKRLLGGVVLEDGLYEYMLWYAALPAGDAETWDRLLEDGARDGNLVERLLAVGEKRWRPGRNAVLEALGEPSPVDAPDDDGPRPRAPVIR